MEYWHALLLGLIQGLTEFLPISSSGHIALLSHLTDMDLAKQLFFNVCVHVGSLGAIFVFFRREIKELVLGCLNALTQKKNNAESKLFLNLVVATFVTGLFGILFHYNIELSFKSTQGLAVGWWITALLLLAAHGRLKYSLSSKPIKWHQALLIGLFQAMALLPGVSRAGATLTAGLLTGLGRDEAFRFAFLLAIPTILMAFTAELFQQEGELLQPALIGPYLFGIVVSAISSYLALFLLYWFLKRRQFIPFVVYNLVLGTLVFLFL